MNLETDKIRLELTQFENLPKVVQIESENPEFIGQYDIDRHKAVIEDKDEMHLSIFDKSDNLMIGHIIIAGLENSNDSIEFRRIVISKKGKGFGKDAISLIKKYCFEDLRAHRVWLDVFDDNNRAVSLYQLQGFRIDGVLRDAVIRDGKYCSLLIMSLLKTDDQSFSGGIKYNGKRFIPVTNSDNGEVSSDMTFIYKQEGDIITSHYSGENIKKGHLIGLVDKNGGIDMRYHQVNKDGILMTGICKSRPEFMNNGKIRLYERWEWTSGDKSNGESILEEV